MYDDFLHGRLQDRHNQAMRSEESRSARSTGTRVVGHLRGTRLNSEFSVSTFSAVLDSLEHADSGKNCPVK